jgi:endonuclease YncB( thermonuclease family)
MEVSRISHRVVYGVLGLLGLVIILVLWPRPGPLPDRLDGEPRPQPLAGPVVRVVDSDTIDVQLDGRKVRVRYIGTNTPETKHPTKRVEPYGPEAAEANRQLVEGKTVRLELDAQAWDRYQRQLA